MKNVIPDADTARRIGERLLPLFAFGSKMKVFAYEQHRTGLTLFGVEIVTLDGKPEIIVTQ